MHTYMYVCRCMCMCVGCVFIEGMEEGVVRLVEE